MKSRITFLTSILVCVERIIYHRCKEFNLDFSQYAELERLIWDFVMNNPTPRQVKDFREFYEKQSAFRAIPLSVEFVETFFNGFRYVLQAGPHEALLNSPLPHANKEWGCLDALET